MNERLVFTSQAKPLGYLKGNIYTPLEDCMFIRKKKYATLEKEMEEERHTFNKCLERDAIQLRNIGEELTIANKRNASLEEQINILEMQIEFLERKINDIRDMVGYIPEQEKALELSEDLEPKD